MICARARSLCLISLILTLLGVASCNSGAGGEDGDGDEVINALLACDLVTDGEIGGLGASEDPYESCVAKCVSAGTCSELESLLCGTDFSGEALLDMCYTQCLQTHGHGCGGELFPPNYVCDGFTDCLDGSDEAECPPDFVCDDGQEIPAAFECDQYSDCDDDSDEVDCPAPPSFVCASGEQIPASDECDFEPDCEDGSDEHGCAQPLCPDNGDTGTEDAGTTG